MQRGNCQALKFFLSMLYKLVALAGLVTIAVTLDVSLSVTVMALAFGLYYVSRAIVGKICPHHDAHEHQAVIRNIRPDHHPHRSRRRPATPRYGGNVTPLRKTRIGVRRRRHESAVVASRIKNR